MQLEKILYSFLFVVSGASAQSTVGVLGTPADGSIVSGVSTISGYHCTSKNIEVFIDGVSYNKAGAGTQLLGTQGVCGRTDTGYSLLYNFSNLDNGQHTISVTADGVPFATNTVTTVKSGGEQWLTEVNKQTKVTDFPHPGQAATLEWVQSYQNYMVTGIGSTAGDLSTLNGSYSQSMSLSTNNGSNCYQYASGNINFFVSAAAAVSNPSSLLIWTVSDTTPTCLFLLSKNVSGNTSTGYSLTGTVSCELANLWRIPATATGLKKSDDGMRLLGTITSYFPGCTQTAISY